MNKKMLILTASAIATLLGIISLIGGDYIFGGILLAVGIGTLLIIFVKGIPSNKDEPRLYKRVTESLESVPQSQRYGKLILTGIKPTKYKVTEKGEEEIREKHKVISGKKILGKIKSHVAVETTLQLEEGQTKEEVLHVFKIKKGLFSQAFIYVYHSELLNPLMSGEDVLVEAIDVFPLTDKHYITSTSAGRKIQSFVVDVGLLASARQILDHLGGITEEALKSNIEHQKRMQSGGQIIDIGKKGVKTIQKGYSTGIKPVMDKGKEAQR